MPAYHVPVKRPSGPPTPYVELADNSPRRKRKIQVARRWVVLVLVVILVGVGGYVGINYLQFLSNVSHIDAIPSSSNLDGKEQNILLVGDDHRPANASAAQLAQLGTEQDGGSTNTDTMMILHIPAKGDKISLISLPRDSWVSVPGFGMNKLNSAFVLGSQGGRGDSGGAKLLISTVHDLTGLTINHFVRVSLLGFYTIAQALGPIQVCLNNAVDDPYSTTRLPAGVSTINAQQALAFVRQRHGLPNGDLDREVRQQYFLSLEAHKIVSAGTFLDPVKLHNVLTAVSSSLETDPNLDLLSLAVRLRSVKTSNLSAETIPVKGTPTISAHGTSISIVQVDTAALPAFITRMTGHVAPLTAVQKAVAADPSTVTVSVANGRAVGGAAAAATATLKASGFLMTAPVTVSTSAVTTIEYPVDQEAEAKAVLDHLPGARTTLSSSVANVTVVLGQDGLTPTPPASTAAAGTTASPSTPVAPQKPSTYSATSCVN
jgi:LCP family protein required for cell wall assembly